MSEVPHTLTFIAIDSWDEDHAVENNQTGFDLHYFTEHEQWELLVDKSSIKQASIVNASSLSYQN